ncbi:F510_1955 family glycosylhydrolase [Mycolicibacterium frederiksbergense]
MVGGSKLAASLLVGMLTLSCSNSNQELSPQPTEMKHIHGLGLDPSDRALYAATHYGLFRVAEGGRPQRVGEQLHDFMGFTVIGADRFLASGHPAAEDLAQSSNLGLIESADGGRTWTPLSLEGEADFHALDYRHGRVYGHDRQSNRIMISRDKKSWELRATARVIDMAVSPFDPQHVLVATPKGLQRSMDGAATFVATADAPLFAYLSWHDDSTLIGIDPTGTLYSSKDAGRTWHFKLALKQEPQALLAAGQDRLFIATANTIYVSNDNGATIELLTSFE